MYEDFSDNKEGSGEMLASPEKCVMEVIGNLEYRAHSQFLEAMWSLTSCIAMTLSMYTRLQMTWLGMMSRGSWRMICDGNRVYFADRGCEGERERASELEWQSGGRREYGLGLK